MTGRTILRNNLKALDQITNRLSLLGAAQYNTLLGKQLKAIAFDLETIHNGIDIVVSKQSDDFKKSMRDSILLHSNTE